MSEFQIKLPEEQVLHIRYKNWKGKISVSELSVVR